MGEDIKVCATCGDGFGEYSEHKTCSNCGNDYCGDCMEDQVSDYGVHEEEGDYGPSFIKGCTTCDPTILSAEDILKEKLALAMKHLGALIELGKDMDAELYEEYNAAVAAYKELS